MNEERAVYLDELTLPAVWGLLRVRSIKQINVLGDIKAGQRLWCWLIGKNGVYVSEAKFVAGHLKSEEGEAVVTFALRTAGQIALKAARRFVESTSQLYGLNKAYGRNTIQLFIAKHLHLDIEYWTLRVLIAQALCNSDRVEVWLKEPVLFNERLLVEAFPGVELRFYSTPGFGLIKLVESWLRDIALDIRWIFGFGRRKRQFDPPEVQKPSVLMLQEDTVRADRSLRGQPHWIDFSAPPATFATYLIEFLPSKAFGTVSSEDEQLLSKADVKILSTFCFRSALQERRGDKRLLRVRRGRRTALRAVFRVSGFRNKFFLLRIASLLRQAEMIGALAMWLNVKVFLVRETYYPFADAMQLVAPDLNIVTLAYQYSNLGCISPIMMSTADKFLIFSDMYRAIYDCDGIAPQEFVPVGYLYDGITSCVTEKARKHRQIMKRAGAKFIVCYFDESVQHDRWGLVSKDDHLREIHTLAKMILTDPTFGVVVKSQFVFNSPSLLYPKDEIIQAAKSTGRYLELVKGVHRNDIYPTEAALVSDLCISHKFGATAALEAAIAGVKTVLLDTYGTRTFWDVVYAQADIEYGSIDALIAAIVRYRGGNAADQDLGDWSSIIHNFDPFLDGNAAVRLRGLIEQSCANDNEKQTLD